MNDLFDTQRPERTEPAEGITLLPGFAAALELMPDIERIAMAAPFRHMQTPGGKRMSAAMTNCGPCGWVSDRKGYRYAAEDPLSGQPWPAMPRVFTALAARAAARCGFPDFEPDACLVNQYVPGAGMGAHRDADERDFTQPIVSVSLGLPVRFVYYGARRRGTPLTIILQHEDVLVMGGPARCGYHGVRKLADGHSAIGNRRVNLTFRRAR